MEVNCLNHGVSGVLPSGTDFKVDMPVLTYQTKSEDHFNKNGYLGGCTNVITCHPSMV